MASSLDELVKNLNDGVKGDWSKAKQFFPHTTKYFDKKYTMTDEMKTIILSKGIYPYDWLTSVSKFNSTVFPSREDFYSQLRQEECSEEDYEKAVKAYKAFNCKTFRDYHDLYLRLDVLLLSDVLHNFRTTLHKQYGLDPINSYITLPGYAWDVLLYQTKVYLEQLTEEDMYSFFEKQIRGGISMIGHRYAKSNNPYQRDYDKTQDNVAHGTTDASNLQGKKSPNCCFTPRPFS
jgi:hypothetical protein